MNKTRVFQYTIAWVFTIAVLAIAVHPCFFFRTTSAEPKTIKVVMDDNFPPYVFRDNEGQLGGILVDQWALWEKKTEVKVQLTAKNWADAQLEMQEGKHDVIDTIFLNPAREAIYDFSKPYIRLDTLIFFNKNLPGIKDLPSLRGFNVGVKQGGHSTTVLKQAGVSGIVEFSSYEAMVLAARDHNLLIFIMEKPPGLYFLFKHGLTDQLRMSEPLYSGEFRRAVKKGDQATLRLVEEGFAKISNSEYDAIQRKWFGDAPGKTVFDYKLLMGILGVAGLIAAVLIGWNWTLRRTVRRKTMELMSSEKKFRELLLNLAMGVIVHDAEGKPLLWNVAALRELGLTERQLTGQDALPPGREYISSVGSFLTSSLFPVQIVLTTGEALREYSMGLRQAGISEKWFQVDAFPDYDDKGHIEQVVVTFFDVTTRRETEQRLTYISFHDALTGIYNRAYFEEELHRLEHRRSGAVAIAIVDVDGLKKVNDTWGHSKGDELLIKAAQILRHAVRQEDVVARIGGDEFAIILKNAEEMVVNNIFDRLNQALEGERLKPEELAPLSLSFGYAFAAGPDISTVELYKTADNLMYQAKARRYAERKENGR
jgi:diguanylate cyclase (GGDEF)-like protein/PAS domain S-box-containing protein